MLSLSKQRLGNIFEQGCKGGKSISFGRHGLLFNLGVLLSIEHISSFYYYKILP